MRVLTCLNLDISVKARKCFLLTYFWASLYFCSDFRSSTRRNKERKKTFVHGIGFGWYQIYFCHAGSPSENPSACTCLVYSSISKPLLTLPVRLLTYNSSTNIMPFAGLYLMYTTVMLSALFYNYRPEFGFIKIDMMLCLCESSIIMDHACCWQLGVSPKIYSHRECWSAEAFWPLLSNMFGRNFSFHTLTLMHSCVNLRIF